MSDSPKCRLALAEAMQLHSERVALARDRTRRLLSELESAKAEQGAVEQAYETFKRAVHPGADQQDDS